MTLALNGPYGLVLRGSDTSASSISAQFEISATMPAAVIPSGFDTVDSGTLAAGASTSLTFNASAGLTIEFDSLLSSTSPINATLTGPSNSTIFSTNVASDAGPYVLTTPGTYTLRLTNGGGAGRSLDFELHSLAEAASPLTLGTAVSGDLNPGPATAVYSFNGFAGQRLFLDDQTTPGTSVSLLLTDPYNNQVLNLNSAQDGGPLTLTAGGTYNLLVVGASSSPVNYQFRLTDTSTVPLAFGTTVNGTLSPASAAAVYTFVGMSGERVDFHGLSESNGYSGASWRLIGPNNQLITTSPFGADLTATLPIVGTYTLVLSNANSSPPTYSFEAFQSVNPSTSLTLGQEVTGNLTNPGDEATYTFTGAPGQRVGFNRIGSNSKLSLQLTDPFGGLVFSQGTNLGIAGPYTLAWAGTYTLTLAGSGPYDFVLDDAAMATPIALGTGTGTTTSGTLATGLSTRLYQFSGLAGEVVYFQGQQDSSSLASVAELYGPTGGFLTDFYLERSAR